MSSKPEAIAEIVGAAVYCAIVYRQLMANEPVGITYARIMRATARVCQSIARRFGQLGLAAELEYGKAMDAERMN